MNTKLLLKLLLAALVTANAAGCAGYDRRDAPWDPKGSAQLIDQIPNWQGAANQICCGHLSQCRPHQSPRC